MDCKALMQESQFIPLENTVLNEIIIRKAEEELGETEQKRKECLQKFKRMIEGIWDTDIFSAEEVTRFGLLCAEKEMRNPITQVCGLITVADMKGFSWSHFFQITIPKIKCFVDTVQDGIPVRNKAMHVINNPGIFSILFDIMKPFLSKKLRNRIYFHGDNLSSLHQFLPPEMLPEEFGGTQGSFANEQFYQRLLASEEEFQQYQKFGYCSSKN